MSGRVTEPGSKAKQAKAVDVEETNGNGNGHRPMTFDHLMSKKKPLSTKVPIVLDNEVAEELTEARAKAEQAEARWRVTTAEKSTATDETKADAEAAHNKAQAELEAAEDAAREATVEFRLQSIGDAAYRALQKLHEPEPEQTAEAKAALAAQLVGMDEDERQRQVDAFALDTNPDTFPPALVAACSIDPVITEEQAQAMWADERFNVAELTALYMGAVHVNQNRAVTRLGKGSGRTRGS